MKTIGERIIFLRENMDMSQTTLANQIGISKMTLYKYERDVTSPRVDVIANLARALNTTADFLVGLTNDFSPRIEAESIQHDVSKEVMLVRKLRLLSNENQARVEERIDTLMDVQSES